MGKSELSLPVLEILVKERPDDASIPARLVFALPGDQMDRRVELMTKACKSDAFIFQAHQIAEKFDNDDETSNHGIRTRKYVKTLAHRSKQMNLYPNELSDEIIERLYKTTQLHDIGKTQIPYGILHKQGRLTPAEWEIMKTHTSVGEEILKSAKKQNAALSDLIDTAIDIAVGHHENWDGSGYPRGLAGKDIPLGGRLMSIADVYDSLISKRHYKAPWSHADACAEIIGLSGTKFDPFLVEAFKREQNNFKLIAEIAKD
jgi:response regulator RpfG family c-di-GMP phosphodiesterase